MPARSSDPLLSILAAVSILMAPFLVAGGGLMLGLGVYRVFEPAPQGEPAGVEPALNLVYGAWPMFLAGVVTTGVGIFSYRRLRRKATATSAPEKTKNADEVIPSASQLK